MINISEKKFDEILTIVSIINDKELRERLMEALCNERDKKKDNNFIWQFVDVKNVYSCLRGVFHDAENKVAVASDGFKMVVSPKHYDERFAGKVVYKDGSVTNERFPLYKNVIPRDEILVPFEFRNFYTEIVKAKNMPYDKEKIKVGDRCVMLNNFVHGYGIGISLDNAKMIAKIGTDGWKRYEYMLVKKCDDGTIYMFMCKRNDEDEN